MAIAGANATMRSFFGKQTVNPLDLKALKPGYCALNAKAVVARETLWRQPAGLCASPNPFVKFCNSPVAARAVSPAQTLSQLECAHIRQTAILVLLQAHTLAT